MKHDGTSIVQVHNMVNYNDSNINGTFEALWFVHMLWGIFPSMHMAFQMGG